MEPTSVIALTALGFSALTFIVTQITSKKTARQDYVEELEQRVERLERELSIVTTQRDSYREENIVLLRKLVAVERGRERGGE